MSAAARRWLRRLRPDPRAETRLLCFHHAGGSASVFRPWARRLPAPVEPVAVQLPGRENRLGEPPFDHMRPLVAALLDAVEPLLREPYACFGSSMGARVALALAHAARQRGLPPPRMLFVANSSAPRARVPVRGWDEPDEGLVAYLRDLEGTPAEVMDDPDLLHLLLPALRADLTVVATDEPAAGAPLDVPIHAFAGADDDEATPARMAPWEAETTAAFRLDVLPGGHFLTPAGLEQVIDAVARELTTGTPGAGTGRGGRLLATAGLRAGQRRNRELLAGLRPDSPADWLAVAGDVGQRVADIEWALRLLAERFARVLWAPGDAELHGANGEPEEPRGTEHDPQEPRGAERYRYLVELCRALRVDTPEDPPPQWAGPGGPALVVPLCLPHAGGGPGPGMVDAARRRLDALDPALPAVLVSHHPLLPGPARVPAAARVPAGAGGAAPPATGSPPPGPGAWHHRGRTLAVVCGHPAVRGTAWHDGVPFLGVALVPGGAAPGSQAGSLCQVLPPPSGP